MAVYNKYDVGAESLAENTDAGADTWRIILSNTVPVVGDVTQADAAELVTAGGYTVNGNTCALVSSSRAGGTYKLVLSSPALWTASGPGFTFRYAILWNQTRDVLFAWWDNGSAIVLSGAAGDSFQFNLSGVNGVFTVS